MKLIFPAVFAVTLLVLPCARPASANVAATATNAKPADAMTALFGDPVIAKGKGFEIKRSELDQVMTGIKSKAALQGQALTSEQTLRFGGLILNKLIEDQLMLQKATEADKTAAKNKTDTQITAIVKQLGSEEVLSRQLKANGMTMAELRSKITQDNTAQAALTRELNVAVTDAEAKQFYDEHPAEFEQPEKVHLCDILLLTIDPTTRAPLSADQQKAKRKRMDDLLKRARSGERFTNLAVQYSEDPGVKDNGGELPPVSRDQMSPELAAAAFSLTNNQVSDIIEMPYGYHVIKLLDKTPAKKLALTDKVPLSDVTIASRVKEMLTQQKTEKLAPDYLDKLKAAADVQVLDADLKAAMAAATAAAAAAAANPPVAPPEK
jgi:parvulin-like peptidyl-prolyl isomerase